MSSVRVHVAAISAFHPGLEGQSVFTNPMVSHFLKGLDRLYLQVRQHGTSGWDLNLVLSRLTAPFEPLPTCSLLYLLYEVVFLVAITSARRV